MSKIKGKILLSWPLAVMIAVFSSIIMVWDTYSTYTLYTDIPSQYSSNKILISVAVTTLMQGIQIVTLHIRLNTNKRIELINLIVTSFVLVDVLSDALMKSEYNIVVLPLRIVESLIFFGLCSEVAFVISFDFVIKQKRHYFAPDTQRRRSAFHIAYLVILIIVFLGLVYGLTAGL